jgi:hypothetical protein
MGKHDDFMDAEDAVGQKVAYYSWDQAHILVDRICTRKKKIYGTLYNINGEHTNTSYNLCKGITKGKKLFDSWYIVDYKTFNLLPDELFEI